MDSSPANKIYTYVRDAMSGFDAEEFRFTIEAIKSYGLKNDAFKQTAITALTLLNDLRYNTGKIKRSSVQHILKINIDELLAATPMITEKPTSQFACKLILPPAVVAETAPEQQNSGD
jgi:hypothetical protein